MEDGILSSGRWGRMEIVVAAAVVALTGLLFSWIVLLPAVRRGRSRRLPPGPKGWPLVGALPYVGDFPHKSFYKLSQKYGPVMYMHLGAVPTLVISNAEMAEEVFQTKDQIFASRPLQLTAYHLTYEELGIAFVPYGPVWRHARKIGTLHLLTATKQAQFMGTMMDEILTTVHIALESSQSRGKQDVKVDLTTLISGMAMNIMTRIMWNRRHRNLKDSASYVDEKYREIVTNMNRVLSIMNIADFLPFLNKFAMKLTGLERQVIDVRNDFDEFLEALMREKEQALFTKVKSATDEEDFMEALLKLMHQPGEDAQSLSRGAIKGIFLDVLLAGADTITVTLDWTFAALLRHPDIMKKAQNELNLVVGENRLVCETDLPNLKYLNAVVKEAFRMYSPIPMGVAHFSMADCKVGGYDVPAGTTVHVNQYAIHRDPTVWENAWEFNPDRFLDSDVDYRRRNFELLPFGSGRRKCPAINMSSNVICLAVAQLLHTVCLSLPEGELPEDVDMSEAPGLSVPRAKPILVTVRPRLSHHIIYPKTGVRNLKACD